MLFMRSLWNRHGGRDTTTGFEYISCMDKLWDKYDIKEFFIPNSEENICHHNLKFYKTMLQEMSIMFLTLLYSLDDEHNSHITQRNSVIGNAECVVFEIFSEVSLYATRSHMIRYSEQR
jgi:hypothetical protein